MSQAHPASNDDITHRPGLDTLRAAASLCVLFAHGGYFLYPAFPSYDTYAFAGVLGTDLFFALAGFLLATQLLASPPRTPRDTARWWLWRGWRVLPLFWLALALHAVIAFWQRQLPGIDTATFVVLAQNLAWLHPAFFGEAWNLPVLLLFFAAAPALAAWAARSANPKPAFASALLAWLLLGIALRAFWVIGTDLPWDSGVRKIVLARTDACVYGALAGCVAFGSQRWTALRHAAVLAALAWLGAALAFVLLPRDASAAMQIGLFILIGFAGALTALAAARTAPTQATRPVAALARWSYPLYLLNMPVLLVMTGLGFGQDADALTGVSRFLVWLALSIALAALVHRTIERPLLRARARRLAHPAGGRGAASSPGSSR